jgi:hypothetical protein
MKNTNFLFMFSIITSAFLVLLMFQGDTENKIIPAAMLGFLAFIGIKTMLRTELGKW